MRYKMLMSLIEWIRNTICEFKDEIHHDSVSTIEEKRSIATVVTKLDEAMMWLDRYVSLRQDRDNRERFFQFGTATKGRD